MKPASRIFFLLLGVVIAVVGYAWLRWHRAPLDDAEVAEYSGARIRVDARGIPTIEAETFEALVRAQGYVVARDRFFHMDLLRRAGAGRLAEVFGAPLVAWDTEHRDEDWTGAADRAYAALPPDQKKIVDAYAAGVNQFLTDRPGHAGIEYELLQVRPEPWQGRDSLLVLLMMSNQLARAGDEELIRATWQEALPAEWFAFLFPTTHPWNRPLFGDRPDDVPTIPQVSLPKAAVRAEELGLAPVEGAVQVAMGPADPAFTGAGASNNWAWCGNQKCFLANDPHLGATVPHLWYAVRLRLDAQRWVVGVAIPGIPGVTLGMNPHVAWAFTNVGEDVDDLLLERLSEDGTKYLAAVGPDGAEDWRPVEVRPYEILVRGGDPVKGEGRFTHRGPLAERKYGLPGRQYSRQWLPLQPGILRLPLGVNFASSIEELQAAFDEMRVPAQNVVMVDHLGNIAYRTSGTGIVRLVTGRLPQDALQGEWLGLAPYSERPRLLLGPTDGTRTATAPRFVATANERIWVDTFGQRWTEDLRAERIRTVLSGLTDATRDDMRALQLDTTSRLHRDLAGWLAKHADADGPHAEMVARWRRWDGRAEGAPDTTAEILEAEKLVTELAIARVRAHLLGPEQAELPFRSRLPSAWLILTLASPGGFGVFGLDDAELANQVVAKVASMHLAPHPQSNRWAAQHPFVGKVPGIGDLFEVPTPAQVGHWDVPRVETPKFGASCRLIWDMARPRGSTWALPVGQSGHPASPHYADFLEPYLEGKSMQVFDDDLEWWFAPRGPALGGE
ncbi:MAG: penicillin acylase family protein [Myxococcales bacterium]|nr:penicillin acylase family protein [Myxococcales bacterium]